MLDRKGLEFKQLIFTSEVLHTEKFNAPTLMDFRYYKHVPRELLNCFETNALKRERSGR